MIRYVKPTQVTEGDWIAEEIKINRKYLTGPKELGISKEQLKKLIYGILTDFQKEKFEAEHELDFSLQLEELLLKYLHQRL